jgi:hypothetical protein
LPLIVASIEKSPDRNVPNPTQPLDIEHKIDTVGQNGLMEHPVSSGFKHAANGAFDYLSNQWTMILQVPKPGQPTRH